MNRLPHPSRPLRIGTRGSPLALMQAQETRDRLAGAFGLDPAAFQIMPIRTTGDRVQDKALKDLGGKGLFTKEIEEALLAGEIDIAVHSMKDMPVEQPPGLIVDCLLPREDVRDAFICAHAAALADLPAGSLVGTSSLRRRAQILHRRPDLRVVEFRGNVQTRLRKLEEGVAACTFLAVAGLNRLGRAELAANPVPPEEMLPAIAQGAIGIERRSDDHATADLLAAIHDHDTGLRLSAERALLAGLDGSCDTPIAGLAVLADHTLRLRGEILRPDGSDVIRLEEIAPAAAGPELGADLARRLLALAPKGFFDWR